MSIGIMRFLSLGMTALLAQKEASVSWRPMIDGICRLILNWVETNFSDSHA